MNAFLNASILAKLQTHHSEISHTHMRQLFEDDPTRFEAFSLQAPHLFLDYTKHRIVPETLQLLTALAESADLQGHRHALFSGENVNVTEHRPALHTALRDPTDAPLFVGAMNVKEKIKNTLARMRDFISKLYEGEWTGFSKKPITDVVHLGIGGSHLGPAMVIEALHNVVDQEKRITCHFVSSLDAAELDQVLKNLNPETTLFIIASKTFTTQETLVNAQRAKKWMCEAAGSDKNIIRHFVATTAQTENALKWGLPESHIFPLWDWVGGRYSLWSSMGLPIAIAVGMDAFEALLAGAYEMDQHFQQAPFKENMPVILALLSFWYTAFFNTSAHAILPYDYRLRSLPQYLQELTMESNGKSVKYDGTPVDISTAPVLFGEKGTEGQHSFHQLLLQGTQVIPCDFIATLHHQGSELHQPLLLSHCFAQSRALMFGKTKEEVKASLLKQGYTEPEAEKLAPHKAVIGNQPSNTLLIPDLTPQAFGALIALYEHKTFVEGVLWSINSFDQYGVELGKEIANDIAQSLVENDETVRFDVSTQGLVDYCKRLENR